MNSIDLLFKRKKNRILSIYFPAGYPLITDTAKYVKQCINAGVDMVEIGIPFSDPLADGAVIQDAHQVALKNGMNLPLLFNQLEGLDLKQTKTSLLLMGYWNTIYRFGVENFVKKCTQTNINGVIIPDLSVEEYIAHYKELFERNNLYNIFLVSPDTREERLRFIAQNAKGFIYMVSMPQTTGAQVTTEDLKSQRKYFARVASLGMPTMIGFGVSSYEKFINACTYANGAIIGTAFVKALTENKAEEFLLQFKE